MPFTLPIRPPKAFTEFTLPYQPGSLGHYYRARPAQTMQHLVWIVGGVVVGALLEAPCQDVYGQDAEQLEEWERAYLSDIGTSSEWQRLRSHVQACLLSWRHRQSVQMAVGRIAEALAAQREVNHQQLMLILAAAGVEHVPAP